MSERTSEQEREREREVMIQYMNLLAYIMKIVKLVINKNEIE